MKRSVVLKMKFIQLGDKIERKAINVAAMCGMVILLFAPIIAIVAIHDFDDRLAVQMVPIFLIGAVLLTPWLVREHGSTVLTAASIANRVVKESNPAVTPEWAAPIEVVARTSKTDAETHAEVTRSLK